MCPRGLTIALALGLAVAACGTTDQPSPRGSSSGSPSSPSSPADGSPGSSMADPGWLQVDLGAPPDTSLTGAYAGPAGLVILGGRFGVGGPVGFTWSSRDGTSWRFQPLPGPLIPALGASIGNVEVVVGAGETSRCAHPYGETTWARRDGGDWASAPFQDVFCAGGSPQIAAGASSFVVAGAGTGDQPFAWWSEDGLLWHDVLPPSDPFPFVRGLAWDAGRFWMVARGDGGILARTSQDGRQWTSWAQVIPVPGIDPMALVPLGGKPLLFTQDAGPMNVWRLPATGDAVPAHPTGLEGLAGNLVVATAAASGRLYASIDGPGGSRLVTSTDGIRWADVPGPPELGLRIVSIADDGVHVLIIGVIEGDATTWSAWIGSSPGAP